MKRHTSVATIAAPMTSADPEAAALGDQQPGAEHLLLAAAGLDDSTAAIGVTPTSVRAAIVAVHARAFGVELPESTRPLRGAYRSADSLKEVSQRTRVLSKGEPLSALHVLRAAAERRHGTVALVIDELGIDRDGLAS